MRAAHASVDDSDKRVASDPIASHKDRTDALVQVVLELAEVLDTFSNDCRGALRHGHLDGELAELGAARAEDLVVRAGHEHRVRGAVLGHEVSEIPVLGVHHHETVVLALRPVRRLKGGSDLRCCRASRLDL